MSYDSEFLIENNEIKEYYGAGGRIEIPMGVASVKPFAFCYCEMDEVIIPESFVRIKKEMFRRAKTVGTIIIDSRTMHFGKDLFEYAPGTPKIEALRMPLGDIPPEIKPNCCLGFAAALARGDRISAETKEQYLKYIKGQRKTLYPYAVKDRDLLRLMISEKFLTRDECDGVIKALSEIPDMEMATSVMEYRTKNFKPVDPFKEMMREASRDPFSRKEMKTLWKFEDRGEEIRILAFLGNSPEATVPERIGKRPVTEIGPGAFTDSYRRELEKGEKFCEIESVFIPDSVRSVGREAMKSLDCMTSLRLPDGITEIAPSLLADCRSLPAVSIPDSVTEICMRAFLRCASLKEVTVPENVTYIGQYAFSECGSLMSVSFGKKLRTIDTEGFSDCHNLEKVKLFEGVERLGYGAFGECENLEDVWLPRSLSDIGRDAFFGDRNLTLHVYENSYAHEYAEKHHLDFVIR